MKCGLFFNSLTATLFYSSFVIKNVFYSKIVQYAYNFCGTDLYVNVCRGAFRAQSKIYGGASLQKSQKSFIVDVRLGSKYGSGTERFTEKVYRMSIFIWYRSKSTSKIFHYLLFS